MKYLSIVVVACMLFVTGCASVPQQQNVNLNLGLVPKEQKIGLYVSPLPKITTSFPGANCLLCLGAAALANSSLTKQVETFQAEELAKTKANITAQLKAKGYEVVDINSLIPEKKLPKVKPVAGSTITRNYSSYKSQHNVDQLLVVNFTSVGVVRQYSSYVPVGAPQASVSAQFYMIDTARNSYNLYAPINLLKSADGEWDAPPTFPGMTNAFYQAEEEAVDLLKKPFN